MRVLLAILLPFTAFFRLHRTGAGIASLLLQLGWRLAQQQSIHRGLNVLQFALPDEMEGYLRLLW